MLFLESHAGWLLLVHLFLAGALVAAATHLVVWMRSWPRGKLSRPRGVRLLAAITACLFVATFAVGNVIYPVYKVRVKVEYFEQGSAVVQDAASRAEARHQVRERYRELTAIARGESYERTPPPRFTPPPDLPRETAKIARWFDAKEHWVGVGLPLAIGLSVLLWAWRPRPDQRALITMTFLMAVGVAGASWLAAIIGAVTAHYRSIGGIG